MYKSTEICVTEIRRIVVNSVQHKCEWEKLKEKAIDLPEIYPFAEDHRKDPRIVRNLPTLCYEVLIECEDYQVSLKTIISFKINYYLKMSP